MKKRIMHDPKLVEKILGNILKLAREALEQRVKERFVLSGWKEIRKFFGVAEVHTAMRWAKVYKLPVMRIGTRVSIPTVSAIQWYTNIWRSVHREGGSSEHMDQLLKNLSHVTSRKKKA